MLKAIQIFVGIILFTSTTNAGININFDDLEKPKDIGKKVKVKKDVKIVVESDSNKVLRLTAPMSFIRIPIKTRSKNLSVTLDWRSNSSEPGDGNNSGLIFNISDYQPNKSLFKVTYLNDELLGSNIVAGKRKMKLLTKLKAELWYRLHAVSNDGNWTLTVTNRGKDNKTDNGEVMFNSKEKGLILKTNTKVKPRIIVFSQWPNGHSFDYDNIIIE